MLATEHLHILLIEPSHIQAQMIKNIFAQAGVHLIRQVRSGQEAFDALREMSPDLIVSAYYLPDMTGNEWLSKLRQHPTLSTTPFILVSSETQLDRLDQVRQGGALAILPKPFNLEQLEQALQNTVAFLDFENSENSDTSSFLDLNVLIVDDSAFARKHIRALLETLGFSYIQEAQDGQEAIYHLEHHLFDLVLTDYNMPNVNGQELTEFIRTKSMQTSTPVIMITSECNPVKKQAFLNLGLTALFDKPIDIAIFRRTLFNSVQNHRAAL